MGLSSRRALAIMASISASARARMPASMSRSRGGVKPPMTMRR